MCDPAQKLVKKNEYLAKMHIAALATLILTLTKQQLCTIYMKIVTSLNK